MTPLSIIDDAERHYRETASGTDFDGLDECEPDIRNIGWTIGNDCPYRCTHCYSMSARRKGADLELWMVERIVGEFKKLGVKTVNLGGNEPLFTNGADPRKTILPEIIDRLVDAGIDTGLTTSGITLLHLERHHNRAFRRLNDIDISLDSPFCDEHNRNRGAPLYKMAIDSLQICKEYGIDHTIIMCAMSWNFSDRHIDAVLELASEYEANIRINPLKPVEARHTQVTMSPAQFYRGFSRLIAATDQVDLGEPLLAAATSFPGRGCPCGRTSFRVHSITPDGRIPVSPCVYVHDFKSGDLLRDDGLTIIHSPQFRAFRRRNANPGRIPGCEGCPVLEVCRGGCAARSYFYNLFKTGKRTLEVKDPYCLRDQDRGQDFPNFPSVPRVIEGVNLVHKDYLCTWIGKPKPAASPKPWIACQPEPLARSATTPAETGAGSP